MIEVMPSIFNNFLIILGIGKQEQKKRKKQIILVNWNK